MKYVKMLALAAAAAGVLMAFVGTSTSSALVWCTENKNPCPKAKTVLFIHESRVKPGKLVAGSTTLDECQGGDLETSEAKQGSGSPITAAIAVFVWGECTKTTDTLSNGSIEITEAPENKGTVVLHETSFTANTIFGSCTYGAGNATDVGTLESVGEEAFMTMNASLAKVAGSAFCPATVNWQEKWKITNHKVVYVVSEGE
jgi:hypothetical protein